MSADVSWSFTTAAEGAQVLKVSCLGDGVTEFKYPAALQNTLGEGYEVGNFGSGGTCVVINNGGVATPYINTAVCQQSQQFQPNIVVIMLGTNDSDPAIYEHIDSFVSDYKQLIEQFQALPSHPTIWLVMPSAIFGPPYQLSNDNLVNGVIPLIQQVADEMGLSTIDCYTPTAGHPEYFRDGVHLNDTGAAVVANVIAEAIR
jgi:alpha-L-fucosidase 2